MGAKEMTQSKKSEIQIPITHVKGLLQPFVLITQYWGHGDRCFLEICWPVLD